MNILDVQDKLKGLSQNQLIQEMQMPSGAAPQFLVLSELTRRKRLKDDLMAQQQKGPQRTVAEEAVAAAGVPQAGLPQLASAMAPKTDVVGNTGAMPTQAPLPSEQPQMMADGGPVRKMQEGGRPVVLFGQYFEVLPGGEVVRAGTGDPVSPATAQEVLAKVAQETPVFDPNKPVFDQTALGELRQTPQQFYETAMGEGVRAQGVNPSYDPMTAYYREMGATAPAPLTPPASDALPAIGAPTDFTRFAPLYDYGVPEGFSAPSQDPLGLSREAMQPAGFWADTTDDARAARGFGQSAYLSGLVGPTPAVPGAPAPQGGYVPTTIGATELNLPGVRTALASPPAPVVMPSAAPGGATELNLPGVRNALAGTPPAISASDYPYMLDTQTGGGTFSADPINVRLPKTQARPGWLNTLIEDTKDTAAIISPFASDEDKQAAAERLREINEAAAEPVAAPDAPPAPKPEDPAIDDLLTSDVERSSGGAAATPSGAPGAPSGGAAATPSGAPGASSFEDELLAAIGRSEKRAEQDKWLALAQAGLAIMDAGSRHGTLAGALGEGGAKGIEAFRGGRDAAEETRLNLLKALEDSRMARAQLAMQQAAASRRGGGGGGGRSGLTPYQAAQMARYGRQDAMKMVEMLSDAEANALASGATAAATTYGAQRKALMDDLLGVPAGPGAVPTPSMK